MEVPDWVLIEAKQLSPQDFDSEFHALWSRMKTRFLKLECWQEYQEPNSKSLTAFMCGDTAHADKLLQLEAAQGKSLYEDVARRKIDYTRIRIIRQPLTPYLRWEMRNYKVRAAMGETIVFIDDSDSMMPLPNEHLFDFLLFDRDVALVHNYGNNGLQVSGWLVKEPNVLSQLEEVASHLRNRAIPLSESKESKI